jgi:cathepsin L
LTIVSLALGGILSQELYAPAFEEFKTTYGKEYAHDEHQFRFQVFMNNLDKIIQHNSEGHSFTMEMNEFGDLTADEFKTMYASGVPSEILNDNLDVEIFSGEGIELASSVDWTTQGVVTAVKNQGQCGSCWAFSTTGSIESAVAIKYGQLQSLSEQQLVDCSTRNYGCNGGWPYKAMDYVKSNGGLCKEGAYPYTARDGSCKSSSCTAFSKTITGYQQVQAYSESALMAALNQGPVSILVEADQSSFQFYRSGVLSSGCGHSLDHAVLAVGYGTSNGVDYWKVKNSWGSSWGSSGYIYLARGKMLPYGVCGILSSDFLPTA